MDNRLRVHGHPVQPMLVTFPFGLFACATIFDAAVLFDAPALLGQVGYWTAVAGLVAAVLTATAGMVELWDAPDDTARRATLSGTVTCAGTATLFIVVCLVRAGAGDPRPPSGGLVAVELAALALGTVGIVLAGRLARQLDRGRREAAGFDAFRAGPASSVAEDASTPR